ncbi:MAG TPA: hypothetical protein VE826_02940 [Dongiaceae bacterium]|nr:hypothetical protein [Dongiaceae bacterium]
MIDVVVAYDRSTASVVGQVEFHDDPIPAFAKRLELERAYRKQRDVEVVLVSARTFEDLKKSHARYFNPTSIGPDTLKRFSERLLNRAS